MWKDVITLRSVAVSQGPNGYPVYTNTDTEVYADVRSVTRAEFYAANANGINAVFEVEVRSEDWGDQTQILISRNPITGQQYTDPANGEPRAKEFYIVRAYRKGQGSVVLTCSDKAV